MEVLVMMDDNRYGKIYERLYTNRKSFGDYDLYKINNEEELKILIADAMYFR